jgi:hypothetical protein
VYVYLLVGVRALNTALRLYELIHQALAPKLEFTIGERAQVTLNRSELNSSDEDCFEYAATGLVSNQDGERLKEDSEVEEVMRRSDIYMIVQRREARFVWDPQTMAGGTGW